MGEDVAGAFDAFYRAEYGRLAGALRLASGGDRRLGEELAQEAMSRAWAHWTRVQAMDRPAGWLYATGFNLVRRRGRTARRADPVLHDVDHLDAAESRLAIERALAALPTEQRKAVVARHVLRCTTEESAELLGISQDALRSLLHRAVTALRQSPALAVSED